MFEIFLFLVSLSGLIIATYTDLKERIIPNKLTYSMIVFGLIVNFLFSFFSGEWLWFNNSLIGGIIAFVLGYVLWKAGVWAGGDVKLLTGLATLNPINFGVIRDFLFVLFGEELAMLVGHQFGSMLLPIFPITLFIFSVFAMLPFAVLISVGGIFKRKDLKKKLFKDLYDKIVRLLIFVCVFAGLDTIVTLTESNYWLVFIGLIFVGLFPEMIKYLLAIILLGIAFVVKDIGVIVYFGLLITLFFVYLLIKIYVMSVNDVLKKPVKISDLEEGMISGETITKIGSKIVRVEKLTFKKILKCLKNKNIDSLMETIKPKGKIIISTLAGGLTIEQIKELQKLVKAGKIENKLVIKESTAFVPAMLIAYILLQIIGDLLWVTIL